MTQAPVDHSTHRGAALALAAGTSLLAVLAMVILATDLSKPAYIMPLWVLVVAVVCVLLTMIGGAVAARRRRVTPWLAPAATGVMAAACLELPLAFPVFIILLVLVTFRAGRRVFGRVPDDKSVGTPGFLLTAGLVPLFLLIFLGRPVVDCTPGGVSSAVPVWAWFGYGNGGAAGSESSDGTVSTGSETIGATTYSWVCDGSTVAQFTTRR